MVRVVGLTGGIGSGKSTVARMLAELGATVIDADRIAREVVEPGTSALSRILERFGAELLMEDGSLDRRALGRRVFGDDAARRDLEGIVHPEVARVTAQRIQAALEAGAPLVVYDVPLLFENGLEKNVMGVIVVRVSPERQRARIRARDDLSDAEIEARIAAQMPLEDKAARADWVIDNDGTLDATRAQVEALYARLVGG